MSISSSDSIKTSFDKPFVRFDEFFFKIETFFNFMAAMYILGIMFLGVCNVLGRTVPRALGILLQDIGLATFVEKFDFLFVSRPVRGYVDVVEISVTVFAFLALSYCWRLGGHIRMEIIIGRFSGRVLWIVELIGILLGMVVIYILMVYAWGHFMRAWTIGDSTIDVEIETWPSKIMVPFAFAMLLIRMFVNAVGFARLIKYPSATPLYVPLIETVEEAAQAEIDAGLAGEDEKVDVASTMSGDEDAR
jgi:TRAP-type mannitol/chloroaromatic compound transport system permease small subunit